MLVEEKSGDEVAAEDEEEIDAEPPDAQHVAHDRHEQAAVGVDGYSQVDRTVVGDRAGGRVDGGVELRVRGKRFDGGLGEERQERQFGSC